MTDHRLLPPHWSGGTTQIVAVCTCGWVSPAVRPETGHALEDLKDAHRAHREDPS